MDPLKESYDRLLLSVILFNASPLNNSEYHSNHFEMFENMHFLANSAHVKVIRSDFFFANPPRLSRKQAN